MDFNVAPCQAHLEEGIEFRRQALGRARGDRHVCPIGDARIDPDPAGIA
jgi:hypothetical protein